MWIKVNPKNKCIVPPQFEINSIHRELSSTSEQMKKLFAVCLPIILLA